MGNSDNHNNVYCPNCNNILRENFILNNCVCKCGIGLSETEGKYLKKQYCHSRQNILLSAIKKLNSMWNKIYQLRRE